MSTPSVFYAFNCPTELSFKVLGTVILSKLAEDVFPKSENLLPKSEVFWLLKVRESLYNLNY